MALASSVNNRSPSGAADQPLLMTLSDVIVRTFQDADAPRVRELFRTGMYSLTPAFYQVLLMRSRTSQAVWGIGMGILIGLAFAKRFQAMWAVGLLVASYAGYLQYLLQRTFQTYVNTETETNLSDVSNTYIKSGGTFLVAVDKLSGRIVGMVGGEKKKKVGGTTMELKRMSVDTTIHSRGLGTKIFEELQKEAKRLGFKKIVLSCTTPQWAANRLYRKCGFTLVKETEFGLPGAKICFYEKELQ